jgi:hypothetical protein
MHSAASAAHIVIDALPVLGLALAIACVPLLNDGPPWPPDRE